VTSPRTSSCVISDVRLPQRPRFPFEISLITYSTCVGQRFDMAQDRKGHEAHKCFASVRAKRFCGARTSRQLNRPEIAKTGSLQP
jgi:hypothetical protein